MTDKDIDKSRELQDPQDQQLKRRKRTRRPECDKELIIIWVLIGVVGLAIVVGIVMVAQLLLAMGEDDESSGGLYGGQFATDQRGDKHQEEQYPDLPPSKVYTIPHSMPHIGDRSDEYAELRKVTDEKLPYQPERSVGFVQEMIQKNHPTYPFPNTFVDDLPYDIYNCPETPPSDYPYEWSTMDILKHWNPEETRAFPDQLHQGLCVFDYRKDYIKALTYRNAELPFVVRNDPEVSAVVERWAEPGFMERLLGTKVMHRAERSESNHFVFWVPGSGGETVHSLSKKRRDDQKVPPPPLKPPSKNLVHEPPGWSSPTKMIRMTFDDFLVKAKWPKTHDEPHWYFRLIGCGETGPTGDCDAGSSEWLFDELTFFQPRLGLLYLKDPKMQRGIHCRIGMEGVTIANHFDQSRNAIALLGGERRYILSHPKHCHNLALYPRGHPSARHSAVDWSNPDLEAFPEFTKAMSSEVLLQAGDVLYLPTNYFHYIVNLGLNYQCNTRSGTEEAAMQTIRQCGF